MARKNLNLKKVYHGLLRKISRLLRLHPTSSPYISGDTFRNLANHIHDMDSSVDPTLIKNNDIVFVQAPRMQEFFSLINPKIQNPYILITHNGDQNITSDYLPYLTENIKHWFAQNCLVSHPKITPIPIGLENKWYFLHGIPSYYNKLKKTKTAKQYKILYKFSVATNPTERGQALITLEKHPLAETYADWRESWKYLNTLNDLAFVASPAGNGEDCHRTWEAMYLGTIPILKRNPMSEYFHSLGLPIVLISDWSELNRMTQKDLCELYEKVAPKLLSKVLWFDFWFKKIKDQQT